MSRDKRAKIKGRRGDSVDRFAGVPVRCLESQHYIALSYRAKALLVELAFQYNGFNNGNLSITPKLLKPRGWPSHRTIYTTRDELEQRGWIVTTRFGGRNNCSLYALTYQAIDDCNGKHEAKPSNRPLDFWKLGRNPWLQPKERAA